MVYCVRLIYGQTGVGLPGCETVGYSHGQEMLGENVVAVIHYETDDFHLEGCEWCDELRKRCQSRRAA